MQQELAEQIRQLLLDDDTESLRYILAGESRGTVDSVCQRLSPELGAELRKVYEQVLREGAAQVLEDRSERSFGGEQRNKRIDAFLEESRRGQEKQRKEYFLQFLAKSNEKLIFEQHFGFPFFDLIKRVLLTHGDPRPQAPSVKAVHSQVQIMYGVLFSSEGMGYIGRHWPSLGTGLREYLCFVFPGLTEKYFKFHHLYRNLKKEAGQRPQETSDAQGEREGQKEGEGQREGQREMTLQEDATLQIDEKQFLVFVSESAEEFESFEKNRSYNFLCFGLRKYQAYIGLGPTVFSQLKQKQFCDLLSFLSIRFIRRMIFTIIRERNKGALRSLTEPITQQEIRRVGNGLVDQIGILAKRFTPPQLENVEERARGIFLSEFQGYAYAGFVPRGMVKAIRGPGESFAEYVWRSCREYKQIWSERVRVDHFLCHGGARPKTQFLEEVEKDRKGYQGDPGQVWKEYLRRRFGFTGLEQTEREGLRSKVGKKKMKLESCTD